MYAIHFLPSAAKALAKLDRRAQVRVARSIGRLAEDPRRNATRLVGSDDMWRVRAGDYRIVYRIEDAELVILVVRVGHRADVYRRS